MGRKSDYLRLVEEHARVKTETDRLVMDRLYEASSIISCVLSKRNFVQNYGGVPKELEWTQIFYKARLEEIRQDEIIFTYRSEAGWSRILVVPRYWIHLSNRQVGAATRRLTRERGPEMQLVRLEKEIEYLVTEENRFYRRSNEGLTDYTQTKKTRKKKQAQLDRLRVELGEISLK